MRPNPTGWLLAALALIPVSGSAQSPPPDPSGTGALQGESILEDLVQEALERNLEIAALLHGIEAARHRIPQAGALDDPMAGIAFSNFPVDSFATDDTPMTGVELRYSQRLPWPGKRGLREEISERDAAALEEGLAEARNRVSASVRQEFYEIFFLDRSREILERNRDLLQDIERAAEERYAVGKGVQADVVRAQVALSRVLGRLIVLKEQREDALARLNALRDRPPDAGMRVPGRIRMPVLMEGARDRLVEMAVAHRPALARLERMVEKEEAKQALARKDLHPDFTAAAAYRLRDEVPGDPAHGVDFVSASLAVNLPIFARNKQRQRIAEATEEADRWRGLREDMLTRIRSSIEGLVARIQGGRREVLLYEEGILPQAEQSLASSRSGYEVDRLDFLSYLDAQITLLNEQVEHYRVLTRTMKDLARLAAEVGVSPDALPLTPAAEEVP